MSIRHLTLKLGRDKFEFTSTTQMVLKPGMFAKLNIKAGLGDKT